MHELIGRAKSIKPNWLLTPLPYERYTKSHPQSSLHSICLNKISQEFHLYTVQALSGLSPILLGRVMQRVRRDRWYEAEYEGVQRNPDITTIWALSALLDPEGEDTQPDHTIALPLSNTLHYLQADPTLEEPEHPFIVLPKLFREIQPSSSLSFLTTLTLDAMDRAVTDESILNLRYCTHLTVLHMRGCGISDTPIRLLASALDLDTKKGMCRLRAWFMPGCKGVGDRTMRSLARWPGLCAVDVRGTSVTAAGMGILNRFQRTYFGGENADYQACTTGLLPLFEDGSSTAKVLESLCLSLLAGEAPAQAESRRTPTHEQGLGDDRWWLALHLLPTTQPLDLAWLPHRPNKTNSTSLPTPTSNVGVYKPGVGMIYGQDASNVFSETAAYRYNLKTALRIEAEEEGLSDPSVFFDLRDEEERRWRKEERKKAYGVSQWAEDRSKAFFTSKAKTSAGKGKGKGRGNGESKPSQAKTDRLLQVQENRDKGLMLVRMVNPDWENLRWTTATTISAEGAAAVKTRASAAMKTSSRGNVSDGLLADIMNIQRPRDPASSLTSPTISTQIDDKPTMTGPSPSRMVSTTPTGSVNPFKRKEMVPGFKPLSQLSQTTSSPSHAISNPTPPHPSLSAAPIGLRFDAIKKRRFDGSDEGGRVIKGMKIFSVKARAP